MTLVISLHVNCSELLLGSFTHCAISHLHVCVYAVTSAWHAIPQPSTQFVLLLTPSNLPLPPQPLWQTWIA